MVNILFIAPPAAGKGTFSKMLLDKYGYAHISAGEVLREEVLKETELGKTIKEIISSGKFIDNNLMKNLIEKKLTEIKNDKPFIMDGYPRTLEQVKDFEDILFKLNKKMDKVIYLNIDTETGLKRVLGRLSCPKCKKGYNKLTGYNMPKKEWLCDECNIELESRTDDTIESYKVRYNIYTNETQPLIEYYRKTGNLIEIDATKDADTTMKEIEKWLV